MEAREFKYSAVGFGLMALLVLIGLLTGKGVFIIAGMAAFMAGALSGWLVGKCQSCGKRTEEGFLLPVVVLILFPIYGIIYLLSDSSK
jgi:uncharacterized membrane protein YiaA